MSISQDELVDLVSRSFGTTPDPRLRELMAGLAHHLHAFVQEHRLTLEEWEAAIQFLTATGQACTDTRQEFVLLSDVLGVSMQVETVNGVDVDGYHEASNAPTASTVLGPFHLTESPHRALGDTIDLIGEDAPCVVEGRVLDIDGVPVPRARIDVWQSNAAGFYDVQDRESIPSGNGRGVFIADDAGRYWFRTVVPSHYPLPVDGPVGALLEATCRHPYRPAHVHFIAEAAGYERITTHVFVAGSDYIDADAVFAVKESLVRDFVLVADEAEAARYGISAPFRRATFDLVLVPSQ